MFAFPGETAITAGSMNDSTPKSWWQRLSGGLKRTSSNIGAAISDLMMRGPLSPERIVEIEESLIRADLGVDVAARIAERMGEGRYHSPRRHRTFSPPKSRRSSCRWRSRSRCRM
jgi:signal recognition particle GTPase